MLNQDEIVIIKLVNHWDFGKGIYSYVIPHWFAVLVIALVAGAPWIRQSRFRFTLRTLLIAVTLFATVLGLIVAAA